MCECKLHLCIRMCLWSHDVVDVPRFVMLLWMMMILCGTLQVFVRKGVRKFSWIVVGWVSNAPSRVFLFLSLFFFSFPFLLLTYTTGNSFRTPLR